MLNVIDVAAVMRAAAVPALTGAADVRGQRVGVVVTGGSVDMARFAELLKGCF